MSLSTTKQNKPHTQQKTIRFL